MPKNILYGYIDIPMPSCKELKESKLDPIFDNKGKLNNLKFSYRKAGENKYTTYELAVKPDDEDWNPIINYNVLSATYDISPDYKTNIDEINPTGTIKVSGFPDTANILGNSYFYISKKIPLASLLFNPHLAGMFNSEDDQHIISRLSRRINLPRENYNAPDDFKLPKKYTGLYDDVRAFDKYVKEKQRNDPPYHYRLLELD